MIGFYSGLLFTCIGGLAIFMNVVLILALMSNKLQRIDLKLSLVLAIVDAINPMATTAYVLVTQKDPSEMQSACKVKGPIDFIAIFLSLLLMALVARTRCALIVNQGIRAAKKVVLGIYVSFYLVLVAWIGYHDEYQVSPSGVDCSPDSAANVRSALLLFLLGLSLFIFSLVALVCYAKALLIICRNNQAMEHIINRNNRNLHLSLRTQGMNRPILLRTLAACSIYLLLSIPGSLLMMAEATVKVPNPEMFSLAISVIVSLSPLVNPCLVLFVHSIIYDRLILLFNSRKPNTACQDIGI